MSDTSRRRVFSKKFRFGFIIYALVFTLVAVASLLILWEYLRSYERSQTKPVVDSCVGALTPDQVTDVLMSDVTRSEFEDVRSMIRDDYAVPFCEGEKICVRDIGGPDNGSMTYIVSGDGLKLLRIVLRPEKGGAGFGRNLWTVSEIAPAEGWRRGSHSVQCAVPENARLYINGREVKADKAVLTSIVYPRLRPSEQHIFGNFTVYRVSGLFREPEVAVISGDGTHLTSKSTVRNLTYYLPFEPEFHAVTVSAPKNAEIYIGGHLQQPEGTAETFYYPTNAYEPGNSEAAAGEKYVFEGFIDVPEVEAILSGRHLELEKPDDDTYIFSYPESELYTLTLSVPKGAEVKLWGNGPEEPVSYSELPGIRFNKIEKYIDRLPEQGELTLTGFYTKPEVTVTFEGRTLEAEISEDGKTLTYTYAWPRSDPDSERKNAVLNMTEAYLTYVSQGRKNLDENHSRVIGLMVSGSDARTRMEETYDSYYWVNGYKETLERNIDIDSFTSYGDDLFEATVSFYVHTIRSSHEVESSGSIRMVFVRTGSGWRAGTFDITG
jgi:hypothetical protein